MRGNARILIVDDEPDFATALETRLRRRGFDAEAVFSGAEAIEKVRGSLYDVMILDLKMPGMDGLEVLRSVRKLEPGVRVIVLTGHGTVPAGIDGMQLGAADFMQKPVEFEVLCTAIEALAPEARRLRETTKGAGS